MLNSIKANRKLAEVLQTSASSIDSRFSSRPGLIIVSIWTGNLVETPGGPSIPSVTNEGLKSENPTKSYQ